MYIKPKMLKKYIIKPLILFLLLSQFSTMAHAIEHQLSPDENEQCLICIHETESKSCIVESNSTKSIDFSTYEKITYIAHSFHLTKSSLYSIRSPPSILI
jgi:hypothetical protein